MDELQNTFNEDGLEDLVADQDCVVENKED